MSRRHRTAPPRPLKSTPERSYKKLGRNNLDRHAQQPCHPNEKVTRRKPPAGRNAVMAQQPREPSPAPDDIHTHLHAIAELLRQPHQLSADAQAALAELVEELDKALRTDTI